MPLGAWPLADFALPAVAWSCSMVLTGEGHSSNRTVRLCMHMNRLREVV